MDLHNHVPDTCMECWATHEVARSWYSPAAQMAHCFVAFREPLPRLGALQATAVAQSARVGTWLRSTALVVSPRAWCRPVRMWTAPGQVVATALMYG